MSTIITRLVNAQRTSGGLAVDPPYAFTNSYTEFLASNGFDDSFENRVTFLFNRAAYLLIRGSNNPLPPPIYPMDTTNPSTITTTAQTSSSGTATPTQTPTTTASVVTPAMQAAWDAEHSRRVAVEVSFRTSETNANEWFITLLVCDGVRRLEARNIVSFFKSRGDMKVDAGAIRDILDWTTSVSGKLIANAQVRGLLPNEDFVKYHTSYSSTAGLVDRFLESIPAPLATMASQAERDAIDLSLASPHDPVLNAAISSRLIGLAMVYYQVNKIEVGEWYQGRKHMSLLPVSVINQARIIFNKLNSLSKDTDIINAAFNMEELAVGSSLIGVTSTEDEIAAVLARKAARKETFVDHKNRVEERKAMRDETYTAMVFTSMDVTQADADAFAKENR